MHRGARIDPLLFCAAALASGPALALHPLATGVAALAIARLGHRHIERRWLVVALLLLALAGARCAVALRRADALYDATATTLSPPTRCIGAANVVGSPVVRSGLARIDIAFEGQCGGRALPRGARVRLYGAPLDITRGDRLQLVADLAAVRLFRNPGAADPRARVALSGICASGMAIDVLVLERARSLASVIDGARAHVRERITATFSSRAAPLARALVLGETDLADDDRAAFRDSGLSHLLAVSGTHLIIAVLFFSRLLTLLLVRVRRLAAAIDVSRISAMATIVMAWLYADFAGGGGSAYRAAAMLSFAMLLRVWGRRVCALRAFAWSLLGAVLLEPLAACDLSFALSLAATAGLLAAQAPIRRLSARQPRLLRPVAAAMSATGVAMLCCAPLLLALGPELPLLGVAANVLAAPAGELAALPLCLLHSVLWWAPAAERGSAMLAGAALEIVGSVAHATRAAGARVRLPPPTAWQLAALAIGLSAWRLHVGWRRLTVAAVVAVVALLELSAMRAGAPHVLRITMLDVGQGDALLVDLPDGKLMLVDAGGLVGSPTDTGERVVLPALRARRRHHVDIVVLSHAHPDHYGGMAALFDHVSVGELWLPTPAPQLLSRLRLRGARLRMATELCGRRQLGGATIDVLAPCPVDPELGLNDNSLVLRIALGRHAALLAGDAEHAAEQRLLERPELLRADLLKVGHHGSDTSSSLPFARAVSPMLALVSCGARNRFGHPRAEALANLRRVGARVARSDRHGAISWQTDGATLRWGRVQ